jgi:hypothetical protein
MKRGRNGQSRADTPHYAFILYALCKDSIKYGLRIAFILTGKKSPSESYNNVSNEALFAEPFYVIYKHV